jgi:hypothetical protein
MSRGRKRHTRKRRRLERARLRTGKKIVRRSARGGRTGGVHSRKLRSRRH